MLESNTGKDIAKVKTWLMQSRFRAAMQVNQHKPCGSLSHCDRTGEREKNALPAIRVVFHAHLQELQITANIMKPLSSLRTSFNILQVNWCLGHFGEAIS